MFSVCNYYKYNQNSFHTLYVYITWNPISQNYKNAKEQNY